MDKLFEGKAGDSITWNLRGNQTKLTILDMRDGEIHLVEESTDQEPILHIVNKKTTEPSSGFLETLLHLPLKPIPVDDRKRAGPPPMPGNLDVRSIWNPTIIVDGKKYFLPCVAYYVQWPKDETDLAGKRGTLYYTTEPAIRALPYWIEIETSPNPVHIRTIDSHAHTNTTSIQGTSH